jgi:hypothetical protein
MYTMQGDIAARSQEAKFQLLLGHREYFNTMITKTVRSGQARVGHGGH